MVLVLRGSHLKEVEKISKIWSQMLETTAENSVVIERYFTQQIRMRSNFRIGRVFPTVTDPENFLGYMKKSEGVPENSNFSKVDQLNDETEENK